ncbi:MAG: DNA cytosine methyltransferase [Patescibacteria group bacterium]
MSSTYEDPAADIRHMVERGVGPGTYSARPVNPWGDFVETGCGLLVPSYAAPKSNHRPTVVDLYCGIGGFSLGFIQAGWHVLAGLDQAGDAMHTYLANLGGPDTRLVFVTPEDEERWKAMIKKSIAGLKRTLKKEKQSKAREHWERELDDLEHGRWGSWHHHFKPEQPPVMVGILGDSRQVTGQFILDQIGLKKGDLDCVIGSPPCQGFSRANTKRSCMDPRNSLVFDFARLVLEMYPKTMCLENVPELVNMTTPEGVMVVDALIRVLEDGGFGTLNALRKALLSTAGVGAVMRGKPLKTDKPKRKPGSKQLALLEAN